MAVDVDRRAVEAAMARLARGDGTAVPDLVEAGGTSLRAAVARHLAAVGEVVHSGAIDELVIDVALELARIAGSWSPLGGALPWRWADHRVAAVVRRHVGQRAVCLDDVVGAVEAQAVGPVEPEGRALIDVFDAVAERDPRVAAVAERTRAVSRRDLEVWLEYRDAQAAGNPSAASAIASAHGLSVAAVRKIAQRVQAKVALPVASRC